MTEKYFTLSSWIALLQKLGAEKQKILSPQLLKTASGLGLSATLKAISRLQKRGFLTKLFRKAYANKFALPALEEIAMFYGRPCYISFESALENYGILSQMPLALTCATPHKIKNLKTPWGEIIFHHLAPNLFEGYKNEKGMLWATPEKALLDWFYIKLKTLGAASAFDELNLSGLNKKNLAQLSKKFPKSVRDLVSRI